MVFYNISLRCKNRSTCGTLMTVCKQDFMEKLNGKVESFTYILNKEHQCNGIKEIK